MKIVFIALVAFIATSWAQMSCGEHAEYKDCGYACPVSCQRQELEACTSIVCVKGCYCHQGYIMDDNTGRCVRPWECDYDQNRSRNS